MGGKAHERAACAAGLPMLGGPIPQGHAPWFPPSPFRTQFAKLRHLGCSFLVAGRCDSEGRFLTLANLEVPEVLPRGVSAPRRAAPAAPEGLQGSRRCAWQAADAARRAESAHSRRLHTCVAAGQGPAALEGRVEGMPGGMGIGVSLDWRRR